jgi:hypothetical protein
MIHSQTHPYLDVEGCFACKISGVSLGFSEKMSSEKSRESVLSKDLDAYKRLRMNGQQPKQIDGAANVESRATDGWQIETGILPNKSHYKTTAI